MEPEFYFFRKIIKKKYFGILTQSFQSCYYLIEIFKSIIRNFPFFIYYPIKNKIAQCYY